MLLTGRNHNLASAEIAEAARDQFRVDWAREGPTMLRTKNGRFYLRASEPAEIPDVLILPRLCFRNRNSLPRQNCRRISRFSESRAGRFPSIEFRKEMTGGG